MDKSEHQKSVEELQKQIEEQQSEIQRLKEAAIQDPTEDSDSGEDENAVENHSSTMQQGSVQPSTSSAARSPDELAIFRSMFRKAFGLEPEETLNLKENKKTPSQHPLPNLWLGRWTRKPLTPLCLQSLKFVLTCLIGGSAQQNVSQGFVVGSKNEMDIECNHQKCFAHSSSMEQVAYSSNAHPKKTKFGWC